MLEKEISQLAIAVRDSVVRYKEMTSVPTRKSVRIRRRDLTLKYRPDVGFAHFVPQRLEKDVWDYEDQERFQESTLHALPEYGALASKSGLQSHLVEAFVRRISYDSFQGLDDNQMAEYVSAFGRELEAEPLPVKVTAFFDGVTISESPMAVSDRFTLRHPTSEDLAEYSFADEHGSFSLPMGDVWFQVVGDLTFDATSTGIAQVEFYRTQEALRLFRVGGIFAGRYLTQSKGFLLHGGIIANGEPARHSNFSYSLSMPEASNLKTFLHDLVGLVPDPLNLSQGTTYKEIAYARYEDALFQQGPSERAITSAITALEALFLRNEPELTHRLGQRTSMFLRTLDHGVNPMQTYERITSGYKIRSAFIHGGSLKPKDRPEADSLAPLLLDYARVCVLAFLQLPTPKEQLLKQLDRAMIDPTAMSELDALLSPVRHKAFTP